MELRQLEYFRSVAEYANFTRASDEMHVSQPTITTSIKNLEEELGFKLFIRERKGVILTKEGALFLETANQVLVKLDSTVKEIRSQLSDRNLILNIGVAPVVGAFLVSQIYGDFSKVYPELKVSTYDMGSYGMINALNSDQINLAFGVLIDEFKAKYHCESIEKDVIHVVLHKDNPLAKCEKLTVEQLANEQVFALPRFSFVGRKTEEAFAKAGITPRIVTTPTQVFTAFNLIVQNEGVSFALGKRFVENSHMDGLVAIPMDPPIPFEIGFVWKKNKELNGAAKKLLKYVKK